MCPRCVACDIYSYASLLRPRFQSENPIKSWKVSEFEGKVSAHTQPKGVILLYHAPWNIRNSGKGIEKSYMALRGHRGVFDYYTRCSCKYSQIFHFLFSICRGKFNSISFLLASRGYKACNIDHLSGKYNLTLLILFAMLGINSDARKNDRGHEIRLRIIFALNVHGTTINKHTHVVMCPEIFHLILPLHSLFGFHFLLHTNKAVSAELICFYCYRGALNRTHVALELALFLASVWYNVVLISSCFIPI